MERFEKYYNELYDEYSVSRIPATEILAVTDQKFVLSLSLYAVLDNSGFTVGFYDDNIKDEVIEKCKGIAEFEDIIPLLVNPLVELNDEHETENSSSWWVHSNTKPVSAKEVIKLKDIRESDSSNSLNLIDRLCIVDLV